MENNNSFNEEQNKLWESYFYPNTEVFVNKKGITDDSELYKCEREYTDLRIMELHDNPIKGNFDIKHLCDIHKYIFGDLYDWAGEFRKVYMKKTDGSYFSPVSEIEFNLQDNLNIMRTGMRSAYNKETLARFVTECYVAFLNTHPFREGNGRAVREFLREFVVNKTELIWGVAYDIDWSRVNSKFVDELMPFGRAHYGAIALEIEKAIIPFENRKVIK